MFLVYDITSTLSWFFTQTLNIARTGFNILDSFQFWGISIIDIALTFGVLSVLLSIVLPNYYNGESHSVVYNKWASDHGKR